jgi:hypothetical protein
MSTGCASQSDSIALADCPIRPAPLSPDTAFGRTSPSGRRAGALLVISSSVSSSRIHFLARAIFTRSTVGKSGRYPRLTWSWATQRNRVAPLAWRSAVLRPPQNPIRPEPARSQRLALTHRLPRQELTGAFRGKQLRHRSWHPAGRNLAQRIQASPIAPPPGIDSASQSSSWRRLGPRRCILKRLTFSVAASTRSTNANLQFGFRTKRNPAWLASVGSSASR